MPEPISVILIALGGAAGKAAATEAVGILRELVGLQQAQAQMLQSVNRKVDWLVEGPFHQGCRQLADALRSWREPADRRELLVKARDNFTAAIDRNREPINQSWAALHLACVWLALGSPNDVRRCLQEAHVYALWAIPGKVEPDINTLRGAATILVSLGFQKMNRRDLDPVTHRFDYVPYANGLATASRAWGTPPEQAPVVYIPGYGPGIGLRPDPSRGVLTTNVLKRWLLGDSDIS